MFPPNRVVARTVVLALALIGTAAFLREQPSRGEPAPARSQAKVRRLDSVGDPLPEGALARFGSSRLFHPGNSFVPGGPRMVAFGPDGKLLASGGVDGKVRLWDPATGKALARLDGNTGWIEALAFSPDSKILASVTNQNEPKILLWNVATGQISHTFPGSGNYTPVLVFTPDSKTLISAGEDGKACSWDTATGKELLRFQAHEKRPARLALSPDGRILFTTAPGGPEICLWDSASGKKLREFRGPAAAVFTLCVSGNGKTLATGGPDRQVRFWDVATGMEQKTFPVTKTVGMVAFSPDDKLLAAATWSGPVHVWETATGKELQRLPESQGLAFAPDSKTLALASGYSVRLWNLATGKEQFPPSGHRGRVQAIACSRDGKVVTTFGLDNTVRTWNPATGKELKCLEDLKPALWTAGVRPDTRILALTPEAGKVSLWDPVLGKEIYQIQTAKKGKEQIVCSADARMLATLLPPATIILRDVPTDRELGRVHADAVLKSIALAPDGRTLAAASEFKVVLWDIRTAKPLSVLKGKGGATAFSEDGKILAVGEAKDTIRVWAVATGKEIHRLTTPGLSGAAVIQIAPGGRTVAAVGLSGELTLWDTLTGKLLARNQDKNNGRRAFAFALDGQTLALGWEDQTVRLLDSFTGQEIRRFRGLDDDVSTLAFSLDSRQLFSGGVSGALVVWDLVDRSQPVPAEPRPAKELQALWDDLGGTDSVRARRSFWTLTASPRQTVAWLRERLAAERARGPSPRRLVVGLDDDEFERREQAQKELAQLKEKAEPALRSALDEDPSPEVRRRVEELLDQLGSQPPCLGPVPPRILRAVRVLEQVGTPEARALLEHLADRIEDFPLAGEAQAALTRLKNARTLKK